MTKIQIELTDNESKKVNLVKVLAELRTKEEAIKLMISKYKIGEINDESL